VLVRRCRDVRILELMHLAWQFFRQARAGSRATVEGPRCPQRPAASRACSASSRRHGRHPPYDGTAGVTQPWFLGFNIELRDRFEIPERWYSDMRMLALTHLAWPLRQASSGSRATAEGPQYPKASDGAHTSPVLKLPLLK